jgi:hypothetical protein
MYDELPADAKIEITTGGGWPAEPPSANYPAFPALVSATELENETLPELPDSLKMPLEVLKEMNRLLQGEQGAEYERGWLDAAMKSFENYRARVAMDPGPGYYRAVTPERRASINRFYANAALSMYNGLVRRIELQAATGHTDQKRTASLLQGAL